MYRSADPASIVFLNIIYYLAHFLVKLFFIVNVLNYLGIVLTTFIADCLHDHGLDIF
jgi:hypothetical protein